MKKSMFFLILALGWLGLSAQKSLVYGKLDRTGYEKVSKGAFWSERPWAKDVYEGKLVPGYKVEVLDQDHFVMFAAGENNPLDRNYIVFPEGEIVIEKDGIKYAAICGNKIQSIRPVSDYSNMVSDTVDQKLDDTVVKTIILRDTIFLEKEVLKVIKPEVEEFSDEVKVTSTEQEKVKWVKRNWWVWPVAAAVLGTAGGFIFNKKNFYWYGYFPKPVPIDEGGPVGAPTHPADTGGPSGADSFGGRGR